MADIKDFEICKKEKEYKERHMNYAAIMARATVIGLMNEDDAISTMMDIESADLVFNLRIEDWQKSDDFNFIHDFIGIRDNIVRDEFPAKDFGCFVPRFAGEKVS